MPRALLLIFIAVGLFLVILFISRPDLWQGVWIWIVGLAGPVVKVLDVAYEKIKQWVTKTVNREDANFIARKTTQPEQNEQ